MIKEKVFFVGAGGIGMAALERYLLSKGHEVGGYDLTETALTRKLVDEGVDMNYEGTIESIPDKFRSPSDTLIVYTPAVPADLPAFDWFKRNGFQIVKRSALLGFITASTKSLCFAGTHGKTTCSSMAAHILNSTPRIGCNAFVGGVMRNYGSNLLLSSTSPFSVAEADEFDRSFHRLEPFVAVITSIDADHLDIYGDYREYLESFEHFTSLIKPHGHLLLHAGLKMTPRCKPSVDCHTYSSNGEKADFMAINKRFTDGSLTFDVIMPDTTLTDLELGQPIEVNVDNAVAAIGAIWLAGAFNEEAVRQALKSFQGSERRFEIKWRENANSHRVIMDDYAHHPKEIESSLKSIRTMFPGRKITVAFQPHLYTRTRDFAPEFAQALSLADEIVLVSLYPAREKPIPGISSKTIYDLIQTNKKYLIDKENFPKFMKNANFEVLVTMGAGDLPNYIPKLIEQL